MRPQLCQESRKVYLASSFQSLPVSDGMFAVIKYYAWESLTQVYTWFSANGLQPRQPAIEEALQTISSLSAHEFRRN